MSAIRKFAALALLLLTAASGVAQQASSARALGTVKTIQGNNISLKTDDGGDVAVSVADSARVLRMAPGQTDLKTATAIQLSEVQAGDRILARGATSADGKRIDANTIVVMKQGDVAARQKKEEEDWQRNGVFGPVKSVDANTGAIVLGATLPGAPNVTLQTSRETVVRKYAPDSPKFDDAKPSAVTEIKPGDQLRARGTRGSDPTLFTAREIVFGTFRNVAGTISAIDAGSNTVTVNDLSTKKPVVVKITGDSQMHKLPQMIAQAIAIRLRGGEFPGGNGQGGQRPQNAASGGPQGGPGGRPGGMRTGDPMQMLARLPQIPLSELQKGDALMIVTTQGDGTSVSAITLLAGVEPILTAPNAQSILSPWNINTGGGDAQ